MKHFKLNRSTTVVLIVVSIFLTYSFQSKFFEVAKQIEIYTTLFKELNLYYIDEINPAEFTNKAIKNTLKELDPYTNFYNEQDVEDAKIRRAGSYGGIGVEVYYTKKGIQLTEIYKGFSADKADLKAGDILLSVDGQSLKDRAPEELSMYLEGVPNSRFRVEIERQGKLLTKELTRDRIVVNPVPFAEMIDGETGYITLTQFTDQASKEVKKAYRKLKKLGMKNLVFDLRSNPGGSLLEAIHISNFFLSKGKKIVTTKGKVKKWSNTYLTQNEPLDLEMPLVVLVNETSASASEIVSGSLQDYDRAVIMGQRTFGKGLVQRYRTLSYGTQLKVTISKYYTPSGRCIQELDYANRSKDGRVPAFSESGIHEFKTAAGRTVYDGGGILPDVRIQTSEVTAATKKLVNSRVIFNFATAYYYQHQKLETSGKFDFSDSDFQQFIEYLKKDTIFETKQEALFTKAYHTIPKDKNQRIDKEYQHIKKILMEDKINEILKNRDLIKTLLVEEILTRYFYKEGVYRYKLKEDMVVLKAVELLHNPQQYRAILSVE
ncbi:S41 family peptidase [Polaribacter sp. HL-MS24]|uniref:S41 family peptidase n=1 Tax=Polaribacter sp. HL-MS24 TaxID=3077735 RepID=UPI0029343E84|nr:S41 family peptidase [Polaribacter sp. HL-MS24]WOC39236.1 S41 family peptidase [Polaribacter sp. HL-MS24]